MRERKRQLLALWMALLLLISCGCGAGPTQTVPDSTPEPTTQQSEPPEDAPELSGKSKVTTAYFGTVCSMFVFDDFSDPEAERRFETVWRAVKELLAEIENAVSVSIGSSDIARFNALSCGESIEIGEHTANILQIAKRAFADTGGLYDPSVFPLVEGDLRSFRLPARTPAGPSDGHHALDFWSRPSDPPRGQMWLL